MVSGPMSEINGGGGIPLQGREVEYATELWLDDPSAFFLHPEGPLSETTPEEWREKQETDERNRAYLQARQSPYVSPLLAQYQAQLAMQSQAYAHYRQQYGLGLLGVRGLFS